MDASTPTDDDRPEWDLLRALCLTAAPGSDLISLLAKCDFDQLIGHALRHKLGPAVGALLEVPEAEGVLHYRGHDAILDLLQLHRYRNRVLTEVALEIVNHFREAQIPVVVNKGVVLQFLLFSGHGSRMMSDVDLMVHPKNVAQARSLLTDFGGVFGRYNSIKRQLTPLSRETRLAYALSPDHLPHAWVPRSDPVVPYVAVDTAYSVTWANCPWQVDMTLVLDRCESLRTVPGPLGGPVGDLPMLEPAWLWLFTVLHLFREAWVVRGVRDNETSLTQFRDVALIWQHLDEVARVRVRKLIDLTELDYPALWVAHHTDAVLGTQIGTELAGGSSQGDVPWNTALNTRHEVMVWDGDMDQRLCLGEPVSLRESNLRVASLRAYKAW